jgi:6-phosphogluconolactonase
MEMNERVFENVDALSQGVLDELLRILKDSIEKRGRFVIGMGGGRTPAKMYELWSQPKIASAVPWSQVHMFWGDERYVPANDPQSNYRMARETLISSVPIPAANVHPVPTEVAPQEACAEAYEAALKKFFGSEPPALDLNLLGLGGEGHTLSLFPGAPALEEKKKWVVAVEVAAKPPRRVTLTLPVANQARNTFFLVAGPDKRDIVAALRKDPGGPASQYPAARIQPPGGLKWFFDRAATS